MYKLGWFSTGRDRAAIDLLNIIQGNIERGEIRAKLEFVFCNRERGEHEITGEFSDVVSGYDIDLVTFSSKNFKPALWRSDRAAWREEFDAEVMRRMSRYTPDLIVLAGYMLIVSSSLCRRHTLINLHPAKPNGPTGTWQEVIWELIRGNAEETGVMMHQVTEQLDRGQPVTYCTFPIKNDALLPHWDELHDKLRTKTLHELIRDEGETNELFRAIRARGVARELPLLLLTLKWFAEGKIELRDGTVFVDGEPYHHGYDLSEEIDKLVRG